MLRWGSFVAGILLVVTLLTVQRLPQPLDGRGLLGGWLVALLALALAAFVPDRRFEFEPATRRLRWAVRRLLGSRSGDMSFADIRSVLVQTHTDTESRGRRNSYRLVLATVSGHLPLTSIESLDRAPCEELAARIRALIGADSTTGAVRSPAMAIAELAEAGYVIDAVKHARAALGLGLTEAKQYVDRLRKKAG